MRRVLFIGVTAVFGLLAACAGVESESACAALETCCTQLTVDTTESLCLQVVTLGNASTCSTQLTTYKSSNECTGSVTGSGTGTTTATSIDCANNQCTPALAECSTLATCCVQMVDASTRSECEQVVTMGNPTSCAEAEQDFATDDLCVVASSSGSFSSSSTLVTSSGSGSGSHSGSGGGCSALGSCCASVGATEQPSCEALLSAAGGNDSTCTSYLSEFPACAASSGSGSGTSIGTGSAGDGCATLATCCPSLPAADVASCQDVVSEEDSATCSEELSTYESAGLCGSLSGSGSGTSIGTGSAGGGCAALATCCASVPASDTTTCDAVVSAGNDAECDADLTGLMNDGLCN